MTLRARNDETEIIDQSHLQGLIERIASLGLTLQESDHVIKPIRRERSKHSDRGPGRMRVHGSRGWRVLSGCGSRATQERIAVA